VGGEGRGEGGVVKARKNYGYSSLRLL
jgi:hypothetical protein